MAQPKRELKELEKICQAVRSNQSVIVLGETGLHADELATAVLEEFSKEMAACIAVYKGSGKKFFAEIAKQLDIPTENEDGKALAMEPLKEEIALNVSSNTLFVLPQAKRLTTGIRYWLEDLIAVGAKVVCFAPENPNRDIFQDMLEIELALPEDAHIRDVMEAEARHLGLSLTTSRLAELQTLAGRNPMTARKVVRAEALGLNPEKVEHDQYLDITPLILAGLALVGVLKFVGLGTGDRTLYIIGGIAIMIGMALRYAGKLGSNRRKRR